MQGDDIAVCIELLKRNIFHSQADASGNLLRIMGDQAATETVQYSRDRGTDASCTDNTGGFAAQFKTEQPLQGEIAVSHTIIGLMKMPVEREHQSPRYAPLPNAANRPEPALHEGQGCLLPEYRHY